MYTSLSKTVPVYSCCSGVITDSTQLRSQKSPVLDSNYGVTFLIIAMDAHNCFTQLDGMEKMQD